jgi:hypothetical protein
LREAIDNANSDSDTTAGDCTAGSGADIIEVPQGHYSPSTFISFTDDFTLRGAGAGQTILDGANINLDPDDNFPPSLVIDVTVESARVEKVTLTGGGGTGILHQHGDLVVLQSEISGNGGTGIWTTEITTMTVIRSTLANNAGGGIASMYGLNVVRVENSTISNNTVDVLCSIGYGCQYGAALSGAGQVEVNNSTIADNTGTVTENPALSPYLHLTLGGSVLSNPINCLELSAFRSVNSAGYNVVSVPLNSFTDCNLYPSQGNVIADPLLGPAPTQRRPRPYANSRLAAG